MYFCLSVFFLVQYSNFCLFFFAVKKRNGVPAEASMGESTHCYYVQLKDHWCRKFYASRRKLCNFKRFPGGQVVKAALCLLPEPRCKNRGLIRYVFVEDIHTNWKLLIPFTLCTIDVPMRYTNYKIHPPRLVIGSPVPMHRNSSLPTAMWKKSVPRLCTWSAIPDRMMCR